MNAPANRVRVACTGDAEGIARVHVATWQRAYRGLLPDAYLDGLSVDNRRAMWHASIEKGVPTVFVAEDDGAIAGFAAVAPSRDKGAEPNAFEIWAIYVLPAAWGRGLGRALCDAARTLARSQQAPCMTLWVFAENAPAKRFYASVGFVEEPASRQSFVLGGARLDEVRYVQRL